MKKRIFCLSILIFGLIGIFEGCEKREKAKEQKILARVGNRTITVNEFLYRTELTIRSRYITKKQYELNHVLLNQLVGEKIFALEAGDDNPLAKRKSFQAYLRGIQEQAMREELYRHLAVQKVKLDTNEIKQYYRTAGREYDVAFYTIYKQNIAQQIEAEIAKNPNAAKEVFEALSKEIKPGTHTVKFRDQDHDLIHESLFSRPISADTVIGPLRLEKNHYLFMKVKGWKDYPAISGEQMQQRWNEVIETRTKRKANRIWGEYIKNRLSGKTVKFNKDVFKKLADLTYQLYIARDDTERQTIYGEFLRSTKDIFNSQFLANEKALLKSPFFTFDNKVWKVEDFLDLLASHPLVYRKKPITREEFPREFRNAIVDLLRDYVLTQDAYKKGLHRQESIQRNTLLWKDALIASYYQNQLLDQLAKKYNIEGQSTKLKAVYEAYVDSLFNAYTNRIQINEEELRKIQLTNIDMVAYKPGVPYPMAVPKFPMIITKSD